MTPDASRAGEAFPLPLKELNRTVKHDDPYLLSRVPDAIAWDNDHGKGRLAAYTALMLEAGEALDAKAGASLLEQARYTAALAEAAEVLDERLFEYRYALETALRRRVLATLPRAARAVQACAAGGAPAETLSAAALLTYAYLKAVRLHLLDEERHLAQALSAAETLRAHRQALDCESDAALMKLTRESERWEVDGNG